MVDVNSLFNIALLVKIDKEFDFTMDLVFESNTDKISFIKDDKIYFYNDFYYQSGLNVFSLDTVSVNKLQTELKGDIENLIENNEDFNVRIIAILGFDLGNRLLIASDEEDEVSKEMDNLFNEMITQFESTFEENDDYGKIIVSDDNSRLALTKDGKWTGFISIESSFIDLFSTDDKDLIVSDLMINNDNCNVLFNDGK